MNWNQFADVARIRALDEADETGLVWTPDQRPRATRDAAIAAGCDQEEFLVERSLRLAAEVRSEPYLDALDLPRLPGWTPFVCALVAGIAGWLWALLGQEREFNLLSLPLLGVLLWNGLMIPLSAFRSVASPQRSAKLPWICLLMRKFLAKPSSHVPEDVLLQRARLQLAKQVGVAACRMAGQWRVTLHVSAAFLALGCVGSLYTLGGSGRRVVWESALLPEPMALRSLDIWFGSFAKLTGRQVALDQLPAMHRRPGIPAPHSSDSFLWFDLYADTLVILVVLPRLLLARRDSRRVRSTSLRELEEPEWRKYGCNLRDSAAVGEATAQVLVLGLSPTEEAQARWRASLRHWTKDLGLLQVQIIAVGNETEFTEAWHPGTDPLLLVVNAALTPEVEVHRKLVEELSPKRNARSPGLPGLFIIADDTELRKRWSGFADGEERLKTRANSWRDTLRGLPLEWI